MHDCRFKTARRPACLTRTLLVLLFTGITAGNIAPLPAREKTDTPDRADNKTQTMKVRVLDEQGQPLAGANIQRSLWYLEDYKGPRNPNRDTKTDANGVAKLTLPARLRILRLWVSKAGYVSEFVNFALGTHGEGRLIPRDYEFRLAKGTQLSGTVVDESGKPIPGVTVNIETQPTARVWTVNPEPISYSEATVKTNKAGKWTFHKAAALRPGNDHQFQLTFSHKDYLSDSQPGELQKQQKITTASLREGSARVVLHRGITVRGSVLNSAGDPVSQGLVIWHDSPYVSTGTFEAQITKEGKFQTLPLAPGTYPFTVVVPGLKPERRTLEVSAEMERPEFVLKPGKRLSLKIVDPEGRAIPDAYVQISGWRGVESLYNYKHSAVPDSQIPRRGDQKGSYLWDWAPEDSVSYTISAKSYIPHEVTLVATEKPHTIQLLPKMVISGNVTDAKTGKPIPGFAVIPVSFSSSGSSYTRFDETQPGQDGTYQFKFNNQWDDRDFRIRIEAPGYRSAISRKQFQPGTRKATANFQLEPAAPKQGTVVNPQGKPVAGATICHASPTISPKIYNGNLDWGVQPLQTDQQGQFELAATSEPLLIRVLHESGMAEIALQSDQRLETITLQPWARLTGRLLQEGQPVPDEPIYFYPLQHNNKQAPHIQEKYSVQTDSEGRFEFRQLPPVKGSVHASLGPWDDSRLTSSQCRAVDLQPGAEQTVTLGQQGVTLVGRVQETGRDDVPLDKKWSINHLISREGGLDWPTDFPSLSFDPRKGLQPEDLEAPQFDRWLSTREHYYVKLASDGKLKVCGVPPGKYDLVLRLYEPPTGCLVNPVGQKIIPINITEQDLKSGTVNLNTLSVPCSLGPQPGTSLRSFQFTDATGQNRYINDLKGRYVLLHAWASWCVPCIKHMPELQALTDRYPEEKLTLIGLNLDKDPLLAQNLLKRKGWNWTQHYMETETDRGRRLTVSAVPVYFLIGPDGLVTAVSKDWNEMQQIIEKRLKKQPVP